MTTVTQRPAPPADAVEESSGHVEHGPTAKDKRGWCLGIFFIILVSVLWAGGSVLVQHIDDIGFEEPFVFVYIASSALAGCIPSYLFAALLGLVRNPPLRDASEHQGPPTYTELGEQPPGGDEEVQSREDGEIETQGLAAGFAQSSSDFNSSARVREVGTSVAMNGSEPSKPLKSHMFMFKIGLSLSVVWFLAQWTYITSLAYTSVTSSTIIANSSALFTYLFNVMAKTEGFTLRKTAGVALALLGAVAVGLADKEDDKTGESVWGDAMALFSAIAYGVYTVILAVKAPSDDEVSMPLVLGYVGACDLVIFLPVMLAGLIIPGYGIFQGLTFHVFLLIVAKSIFDNLLSELFWARAILLTTATVATVGCSLTIPIAFASDFVLHGKVPTALAVTGALLVVGGFFFVSGREEKSGGGVAGAKAGRSCSACMFNRLARSEVSTTSSSSDSNDGHLQ